MNHHPDLPGLVQPLLIFAAAAPRQANVGRSERCRGEIPYRPGLARSENEIFRRLLLQHQPDAADVFLGKPPVPQSGQVTELERVLLAGSNAGNAIRNLARNELGSS